MIKKKSFNLHTPKSTRWAKFQEWNRKWNKIMSGVFCFLIFGLLFAMVIVNTANTEPENNGHRYRKSIADTDEVPCEIKNCVLNCYIGTNITAKVEAALQNSSINNTCNSSEYHLNWLYPQLTVISPGWFKTNVVIYKITITDHNDIVEIDPDAFNDCTFRSVRELEIKKTGITELRRGVFNGLNNLKYLTLLDNSQLQRVYINAFDPLYQLETFRMEGNEDLENLVNVTGTNEWKHLRSLILSNNHFGSQIKKPTFKGCIRVQLLNLSNSEIVAIGPGSFDAMEETLEVLDLTNNFLTHLPSLLLANMIRSNMEFYLSNNLWHCDCDLSELRGYDLHNNTLIMDSPLLCTTPEMYCEQPIRNISDFQCSPTSPLIPTGGPTYSPTTTVAFPNLENVTCSYHTDRYSSESILLEAPYQFFDIKQDGMRKVTIDMSNPDPSLAMVLINDYDYEAKCQYNLKKKMIFDNLNPQSAHLFCLINKSSYTTSPRNCLPFSFDEIKSIWSHNEVIIALVCSIISALVIGLLVGWLLCYRYQRRFQSKSKLRYQSSTSSSSKTITEEFASSIAFDYNRGKYSDTNLRRSYSENSIASGKSYITALTPSPFEIVQWKLQRNGTKSNDYYTARYLDTLQYDILPPPLPPYPNPRENSYETIIEPVYACASEIVPYRISYAK